MKSISNQSILKTIYFAFSFQQSLYWLKFQSLTMTNPQLLTTTNSLRHITQSGMDRNFTANGLFMMTRNKQGFIPNPAIGRIERLDIYLKDYLRRKTKLMHWNTIKMDKIIQTLGKMNYLYLVRSGVVNARA